MLSLPSPDTQAILLLCSSLGSRNEGPAKPLTARQYSALDRWLQERELCPSDLLHDKGRARLAELQLRDVTREGLERLLERGAALGLVVERWAGSGIWIIGRNDAAYPARLKEYLQAAAPPLLYGVGSPKNLQQGGIAMVGSRHAADEGLEFARRIASHCAGQHICVISGAAKGIDSEAMLAAIDHGGKAVGVLAEGLAQASVANAHHDALLDDTLTLISPYEPQSRWFPYTAMERNKVIYGLANAAIIVSSSDEKGGTWAGATEALKAGRIPLYVKTEGTISDGNRKLLKIGARPFAEEFTGDLSVLMNATLESPAQYAMQLPACENSAEADQSVVRASASPVGDQEASATSAAAHLSENGRSRDAYETIVPLMLEMLKEPLDEKAFAEKLNIVPAQAKAWLKRAVDERKVRKLSKPPRYVAVQSLF